MSNQDCLGNKLLYKIGDEVTITNRPRDGYMTKRKIVEIKNHTINGCFLTPLHVGYIKLEGLNGWYCTCELNKGLI